MWQREVGPVDGTIRGVLPPRRGRRSRMAAPMALTVVLSLAMQSRPAEAAIPVRGSDLTEVVAQGPVNDVVLRPGDRRLKAQIPGTRTETFVDGHGHRFSISTHLPAVDLRPFADVLAGTIQGDELADLRIAAIAPADMPYVCGEEALACYAPDDPDETFAGTMVFAVDDPDVVHTMGHEYGHHQDNQLADLAHPGADCGYSTDKSRNWFFERQAEDDLVDAGIGCTPDSDWEHLLPEVFAEDFVALNGIDSWTLRSVPAPTVQFDAMAGDIEDPFVPSSSREARFVRKGSTRTIAFRLDDWTFTTRRMTGLRRSDLDPLPVPGQRRRPLASSRRQGSRERVSELLSPGRYLVDVHA